MPGQHDNSSTFSYQHQCTPCFLVGFACCMPHLALLDSTGWGLLSSASAPARIVVDGGCAYAVSPGSSLHAAGQHRGQVHSVTHIVPVLLLLCATLCVLFQRLVYYYDYYYYYYYCYYCYYCFYCYYYYYCYFY